MNETLHSSVDYIDTSVIHKFHRSRQGMKLFSLHCKKKWTEMERKNCEEGGTIIAARRNLSLWKNDGNRVKERKERSWNVSAMRVDGRHATMHPGRGWSRGGRRRRCGVCGVCMPIPRAVLSFGSMHGRCRKWRHAIPRSIPRLKHDLTPSIF